MTAVKGGKAMVRKEIMDFCVSFFSLKGNFQALPM